LATGPTTRIGLARGLCFDGFGAGGFYVGDNSYHNIRWVMSNQTIVNIAGMPNDGGFLGGPATLSMFDSPRDIEHWTV